VSPVDNTSWKKLEAQARKSVGIVRSNYVWFKDTKKLRGYLEKYTDVIKK
jgi:hypothetical protein